MPELRHTTAADGTEIGFFQLGDGPPLVFASNAFGDAHMYRSLHPHTRRMTDRLSELGWSVVRYDVRGTGSSTRQPAEMSPQAFVRDLEAVVAELGLRRFALAGLHGGAATAVEFAAQHGDAVSHLVLLNPFLTGSYVFEQDPVGRALASIADIAADDFAFFGLVAANFMTRFNNPDHARDLARIFESGTSAETQIAYIDALREVDLRRPLEALAMPSLVVHDTAFPFGSADERERIATLIPNARMVLVAGDGDAEIAAIDGFLRDPVRAAPDTAARATTPLTRRELEILALLPSGATNRELASQLALSERTVARHVSNIYAKLEVRGRAEASAYAIQHGLA